jgi:hypothetical protein
MGIRTIAVTEVTATDYAGRAQEHLCDPRYYDDALAWASASKD